MLPIVFALSLLVLVILVGIALATASIEAAIDVDEFGSDAVEHLSEEHCR